MFGYGFSLGQEETMTPTKLSLDHLSTLAFPLFLSDLFSIMLHGNMSTDIIATFDQSVLFIVVSLMTCILLYKELGFLSLKDASCCSGFPPQIEYRRLNL